MFKAKIYTPSKNVMQSGRAKTQRWVLEYVSDSARNPENLMGWTQSGDTLQQIKLNFDDLESAESYAQEKGLLYTIMPTNDRKVKPRNYADNFKYIETTSK